MSQEVVFNLNGASLRAHLSGALFWPMQSMLVVSDLHFEKASSFALQGHLLPPYDTSATLRRLETVIDYYKPRRVLCLGDSFHDQTAAERLAADDRRTIRALTLGHDWIWICGNHDPEPPVEWGGRVEQEFAIGPLTFRHEALRKGRVSGEVSGHFHPKASVRVRARRLTTRCFVGDGRRLILPAFGAFTGGLDILNPAIAQLFKGSFVAHLLGQNRIFAYGSRALKGESQSGSL